MLLYLTTQLVFAAGSFQALAAAGPVPVDPVQLAVIIGILGALITAVSVIVQVILNKRLRTPADKQSEIANVFNILSGTIQDNRADKDSNEKTIGTLREYAEKLEKDSRDDQELIRSLYDQIHELERRNNEKDERIKKLESELLKYATAIVNDPNLLDEDVENTQIPSHFRNEI